MKKLTFHRERDKILVVYEISISDIDNLSELFLIKSKIKKPSQKVELDLFHFFDNKRWTLNEIIFFAINNDFVLHVIDEDLEKENIYNQG